VSVSSPASPDATRVAGAPDRFPDGRAWRIEIPSVEGPLALEAVVNEAGKRSVPVDRVSQGSGIGLLDDSEIRSMAELGERHGIEVCLWAGTRAAWQTGVTRGPGAAGVRGARGLTRAVEDVRRAGDLGIRSVLVSDIGLLAELADARARGDLRDDLTLKVSIMAAPVNPRSFALLAQLGGDTINVPSDLGPGELACLRRASPAVIDFYVEAPDNIGGHMRYDDIGEIVDHAAPIYLKFGLRNAPDIYPSGMHLEAAVVATARERVRRAQLGVERLRRSSGSDRAGARGMADAQRPQP
jgi:hypothetical protein